MVQRKARAKSGCRTCKVRKVKCDEDRPACRRCVSAGRTCEGYGVWGGGGNAHLKRTVTPQSRDRALLPDLAPISTLPLHSEMERHSFEWFLSRSSGKLPGPFRSIFFQKLLLQASFTEPAVLHAVLALGSLHRQEFVGKVVAPPGGNVMDQQDQFSMSQYSKAIRHVVVRHAGRGQSSIRVALVSCLVFTFIELLRGHYQTAQVHLRNGLKLFGETYGSPGAPGDNILIVRSNGDWVNDCIAKVFYSLYLQLGFLVPSARTHSSPLMKFEQLPSIGTFKSIEQARERLNYLLNEAVQLTRDIPQTLFCDPTGYIPSLGHQQRIRSGLASWFETYTNSSGRLETVEPVRDAFAYQLMRLHYTMAAIISETALDTSETIFDNHTDEFASILDQVIALQNSAETIPLDTFGHGKDAASPFTTDLGWVPALYYTALKCRIHWIRVKAVKLLNSIPHREGIWDATMAACIAQKVVDIEEKGFYERAAMNVAINLEKSWQLPLPEPMRITDVQVELPNQHIGHIALTYRQRGNDGKWKVAQESAYLAINKISL